MTSPRLIPGNPNIQQLVFVNPFFFITVEMSQPNTPFHPKEQAAVGKTNGSAELISYVSFHVPAINGFPGATANTKCFLVPLPNSITESGSKTVQIFSLQPGLILPTTLTFNDRPEPDQQLSTVTFGGPTGLEPVAMENFVEVAPNFSRKQQFE